MTEEAQREGVMGEETAPDRSSSGVSLSPLQGSAQTDAASSDQGPSTSRDSIPGTDERAGLDIQEGGLDSSSATGALGSDTNPSDRSHSREPPIGSDQADKQPRTQSTLQSRDETYVLPDDRPPRIKVPQPGTPQSPSPFEASLPPIPSSPPIDPPRIPPHRRHPPLKPRKPILKPPPPPQQKFSFFKKGLSGIGGLGSLTPAGVGVGDLFGTLKGGLGLEGGDTANSKDVRLLTNSLEGETDPTLRQAAPNQSDAAGTVPRSSLSQPEGPPSTSSFFSSAFKRLAAAANNSTPPNSTISKAAPNANASFSTTAPSLDRANGSDGPRSQANGSIDKSTTVETTHPPSTQALIGPLAVGNLKSVRFRMSTLAVVYPMNGPGAPSEEGKTRKRINAEHRQRLLTRATEGGDSKGWKGEELEKLYNECCRTREEVGSDRVRRALKASPSHPPRLIDLTNELLTHGAIEAVSDLLSVDFGLKKLVLEGCGLDDESLKPLLHSLLVSGSLPTLSLANNKRIRAKGWKMIAIFIKKAQALRFLDLSDNNVDKRAIELLVQALTHPSQTTDTASKAKPSPLVQAGQAISNGTSSKGSQLADRSRATAGQMPQNGQPSQLADPAGKGSADARVWEGREGEVSHQTILDLGQEGEEEEDEQPLVPLAPLLKDDSTNDPAAAITSLRLENCGLKNNTLEILAHGVRLSKLKHISMRRNKITPLGAVALAIMIRDYPVPGDSGSIPTASAAIERSQSTFAAVPARPGPQSESLSNSVTARQSYPAPYSRRSASTDLPANGHTDGRSEQLPAPQDDGFQTSSKSSTLSGPIRDTNRATEYITNFRKDIHSLPRFGCLMTLDVKSNEIKNGVHYIAQVLKRNRTLRVLNLSDNKIDIEGMQTIAEALKYNNTLETLDLSRNPCCGPSLEGVQNLRQAFTVNNTLMRVFLNKTDLTSEGAIALAEFLPESKSLLHLDLTENFDIDIAGVMALAVAVKMNKTIRCLDLNIPANDPDFAQLSQDILQSCVRNTELAQQESTAKGIRQPISAPILKSAVARDLKSIQDAPKLSPAQQGVPGQDPPSVLAPAGDLDGIVKAASECRDVLREIVQADSAASDPADSVQPNELARDLLDQARATKMQIREALPVVRDGETKDKAMAVMSDLSQIIEQADGVYGLRDEAVSTTPVSGPPALVIDHISSGDEAGISSTSVDLLPSPSFSIADSDDESDMEDEELSSSGPKQSKQQEVAASANRIGLASSSPIRSASRPAPVETSMLVTGPDSPRSPVEDHGRSLTLEEGEVFRKGAALHAVEVDEEDEEKLEISGEELKREILEADVQVRRSPRTASDLELPAQEDVAA